MNEHPCSGYTVAVSELAKLLSEELRNQLNNLDDGEEIAGFLQEHLPKGVSTPSEAFRLSDTDSSDELTKDIWYAWFDESDLYVRTPLPEHLELVKRLQRPEIQRASWSIWS